MIDWNHYNNVLVSAQKIPFIRGSAHRALNGEESDSIIQILSELDNIEIDDDAESKESQNEEAFLLPIQIIHNLKGVGIAVIGKAASGVIAGDVILESVTLHLRFR